MFSVNCNAMCQFKRYILNCLVFYKVQTSYFFVLLTIPTRHVSIKFHIFGEFVVIFKSSNLSALHF